ncbi:MAG: hypothetical protein GEU92_11055 [Alphaproteobacteria bacterium]|nr:hypothetical protein [Alphaproteobacteria bacterium]
MQVVRRYTAEGASPYDGVVFCSRLRPDRASDGIASLSDSLTDDLVTVPAGWSDEACAMLVSTCMAADGVPDATLPVAEDDVPRWLWRSEAAPGAARGPETDARQVFDRVAGALSWHGWRAGYFDSAADARAFFDELRATMCRQVALPDLAVLRDAGRWWAYGDAAAAPAAFVTDYRTGAVRRAGPGDIAAGGAVIHGVTAGIAGEGGTMDLWRREAAGLAAGLGAGVNVSAMGGASGPGLMGQLRIGDSAARAFGGDGRAARFIALDAEHPEAELFASAPGAACEYRAAAGAGARLARRHLDAIAAACFAAAGARRHDPGVNPALRFALIAAREAMVSWPAVERLLALIAAGYGPEAVRDMTFPGEARRDAGPLTRRAVRAGDAVLDAASYGGGAAAALLDAVARSTWHAGDCGLIYRDTAEAWNPCAGSGAVRSVGADGDLLFLDDTACGRAHLNLEAFVAPRGGIDADALAHAARLWTVALDIAIGFTAHPTPRLAGRAWEFRAIGLAPANIAGALMALGLAYDSCQGRALAAAAAALTTAAAGSCSAAMADAMGAFPAYARNRDTAMRVLRNHARAAEGADGGYESLGWTPVPLRAARCPEAGLARRAALAWQAACEAAAAAGMRNAQLTLVTPDRAAMRLLDAAAPGAEPMAAPAAFEAIPAGGFRKTASARIPSALRALGYDEGQIADILRFLTGHGTLAQAPGIDHAALRRRGFGNAALGAVEAALAGTFDIRFVFSKWALGESFCVRMLGLDRRALASDSFDLLNALGFSDDAVGAANAYCFGADGMEGAPHLRADHLAVFDTPQPQGRDGRRRIVVEGRIRMLAALQPFVSGGVGHALAMPAGSAPADCREALLLGWRLGLKHLVLGRAEDAPADAFDGGWAQADALFGALMPRRSEGGAEPLRAALNVIEGGRAAGGAPVARRGVEPALSASAVTGMMSQALALAHTARGVARSDPRNGTTIRTGVTAAAGTAAGAEASRRQASEPPGSGVSVLSSADAPVEQRQV